MSSYFSNLALIYEFRTILDLFSPLARPRSLQYLEIYGRRCFLSRARLDCSEVTKKMDERWALEARRAAEKPPPPLLGLEVGDPRLVLFGIHIPHVARRCPLSATPPSSPSPTASSIGVWELL